MRIRNIMNAPHTKLIIRRWAAFLLCVILLGGGIVNSVLPALAVNENDIDNLEADDEADIDSIDDTDNIDNTDNTDNIDDVDDVDDADSEDIYCEHHPEHTEECGYVEAVEGQPCTHVHDENCGYAEAAEGQLCTHVHDGECGYVAEQPCIHSHDERCGYAEAVGAVEAVDGHSCEHRHNDECGYVEAAGDAEGQDCTHEHDEECGYAEAVEAVEAVDGQECNHEHDENCGYVEAVEGQPCQFVCEICGGGPEEETELTAVMSVDESRAVQQEGLIAYFEFDKSGRLNNSAKSSKIKASLHTATSRDPNPAVGDKVDNVNAYFDDVEPGALHLDDTACLVLDENDNSFNNMTELTVEMRIKILERESQVDYFGGDSNWLFYAEQPGVPASDMSLGVVLTDIRRLRILRENSANADLYGVTPQWEENDFPNFAYGNWYTIRIIYKPSNMALYVNDERIVDRGLGSKTSDYFGKDRHLWFGHSNYPNDSNFNGYIDYIKIYNYANYEKTGGGYLEGYIDEQKYILPSVEPPSTTVNMFDYWITGQTDNDFEVPAASLDVFGVRDGGINKGHLLLFAGWNATTDRNVNSARYVGSWNGYDYKETVNGKSNHETWEPFQGIVDKVLYKGYPKLAIEGLKSQNMFMIPSSRDANDLWYENSAGGPNESLAYLFEPKDSLYKRAYPNVKGLFRVNPDNGDYIFRGAETFAELNRDENKRPKGSKGSTGKNKITLYNRDSLYTDFFPLNDATDLFHITMEGKLDKANGTDMTMQSTTDEPFNHYLGMTVETKFEQSTDGLITLPDGEEGHMRFYFTGDDDVWIYIDDVLVADLGGLHQELAVSIDFSTGEINFTGHNAGADKPLDGNDGRESFDTTLKKMFENAGRYDAGKWNPDNPEIFADGSKHTLKFFYLERGNAASRCTIEFNLQQVEPDKPSKKDRNPKEREGTPDEQPTEEIAALDVSTELSKNEDEETKVVGVLASPRTGDSSMVAVWIILLVSSIMEIISLYRTRKRGSKQ